MGLKIKGYSAIMPFSDYLLMAWANSMARKKRYDEKIRRLPMLIDKRSRSFYCNMKTINKGALKAYSNLSSH
jgi:hypothetical protein